MTIIISIAVTSWRRPKHRNSRSWPRSITFLTLRRSRSALPHPELASDESQQRRLDPQALLADQIVRHAARLTQALTRYRVATLAAIRRHNTSNDHSIPF
jgi:hypothetical protein